MQSSGERPPKNRVGKVIYIILIYKIPVISVYWQLKDNSINRFSQCYNEQITISIQLPTWSHIVLAELITPGTVFPPANPGSFPFGRVCRNDFQDSLVFTLSTLFA